MFEETSYISNTCEIGITYTIQQSIKDIRFDIQIKLICINQLT